MNFNELKIIERIQKSLTISGYTVPTPIQIDAIPVLFTSKCTNGYW